MNIIKYTMEAINHTYQKIIELADNLLQYYESNAIKTARIAQESQIILDYLIELNRTRSLNNITNGKHLSWILREYPICIEYLLSNNVNISYGNSNTGDSILHGIQSITSTTMILDYISISTCTCTSASTIIHSLNNNGETVLHCADNEEIILLLLAHGANVVINIKDNNGCTKLHRTYYIAIAQILIHNGADINILDYRNNIAIILVQFTIVKLIEFGINLNQLNSEGQTVLMFIIQRGVKLVEVYFKSHTINGAYCDLKGYNILHYAQYFNLEALKILLISKEKHNLQLNSQDIYGNTPLHVISEKKHLQLSRLIVNFGI